MNLMDCHSHTTNSPDAHNSVEEMCQRAMEIGLYAYTITDHCEVNRFYGVEHYTDTPNEYDTYHFDIDFEKSMSENTLYKEKLEGKLRFFSGIELGQATFDIPLADKIVSDKRLDFVIGSMHQIPDADDFAFIDYNKYNPAELMERYFDEILKLCRWGGFDVLGHLTYTLRYMEGEKGIKVDMSRYDEKIRECFKILVENGKGIEINTSGLRQKYGKTFPTLEYIKMFKEMGGEIITVGSDSHRVSDLGKGIKEGLQLAKEAGFKHICCFKERKPVFVDIE